MLTSAQLATLKADLATNANTVTLDTGSIAINAIPASRYSEYQVQAAVAGWYNSLVSPAYYAIRTDAAVADILNAVIWGNYTPNPAVTSQNAAQATACSMYCQGKMLNLQTMLIGRTTFDATKATQTGGLKDATTALPAGASFANQTGGWAAITSALQRAITNGEKLFASANSGGAQVAALTDGSSARGSLYNGTSGNPDLLGFQGSFSTSDIYNAWTS